MGTLQVGGTTLGVKNASTNKIDLSNLGEVGSITGGNFGTITQRSSSSSSPAFTRSSGTAIDSTVLGNLYGSTNFGPNDTTNATHVWFAWDYGSGVTRKITKLQFKTTSGALNSTGIFLEGSNEASPDYTETDATGDWEQLKSFGNLVNDTVYSYSSPVTATTLKYRHYRIRFSWSSANYSNVHSFVLEDTDSTFDARTALNATGDAPIYACRAWVNFDGNGTVVIRNSGNVSSITDNGGNGDYNINFTTAMNGTNYAVVCGNAYNRFIHTNNEAGTYQRTINTCKVGANNSNGLADMAFMEFAVFE